MGFGLSSFGSFPFGSGTPIPAERLAENKIGSRFVSINNGDFVLKSDGSFETMPQVRQRVILALTTQKGSAAGYSSFGRDLSNLRKIDSSFDTKVRNSVSLALRQLTDVEKAIRLDGVAIDKEPHGRVTITVSYTDLTTSTKDQVSL